MEEVLSMMMETEEENRVVFFSLVCTLVEQTEKVVRHCMEQEYQTWKNTKSLHNLNSIYLSYTSLFPAFTKKITGKMKKFTQMYTNVHKHGLQVCAFFHVWNMGWGRCPACPELSNSDAGELIG
jgi:hypothetical protein